MSTTARAWLAEALGAFFLVFVGGLSILAGQGTLIVVAFGFGLALMAGLYAFGEISGGHFNPAVSLAALLDGRIDGPTFATYVVAQAGGGVLGGVVLLWASDTSAVASTATVPSEATGAGSAFLLEVVLAALFVGVILKVTQSEMFGRTSFLAIGLTLAVVQLAIWPMTGASVNPARSLGSALPGQEFTDFWIYVTAPFIGAAIGWVLYRVLITEAGERELE